MDRYINTERVNEKKRARERQIKKRERWKVKKRRDKKDKNWYCLKSYVKHISYYWLYKNFLKKGKAVHIGLIYYSFTVNKKIMNFLIFNSFIYTI